MEVDTPNAAFTIEHPGYYRVDVTGERTAFITRRGGQATVTPASGAAVVDHAERGSGHRGHDRARRSPPTRRRNSIRWDKWNYARTETLLDAVSARYVSPGTYGVRDLDRYGTLAGRSRPTAPSGSRPRCSAGWAPYSTGSWTLDPVYGWTWVDTAPWGWAPYHYGRWVSRERLLGLGAGAGGGEAGVRARPRRRSSAGPACSVGISIGGPVVGWVALGLGRAARALVGADGFRPRPSWGGWGGPRVVNNVVINNTTVVNVQNINVYRNATVQNAVVVVNENRFGRGPITTARVTQVDVKSLQPTHTAPQVTATAASFVPTASRGVRPPEASLKRAVVATRPPHAGLQESAPGVERKVGPPGTPMPAPRIVSAPPRHDADEVPARPALGQSRIERPLPDRATQSRLRSRPGLVRQHHRGATHRWRPRRRVRPRRRPLPRHYLRLRPVGLRSRRWLPRHRLRPRRRSLPRHHLRPWPARPSSRTWWPHRRPFRQQRLRPVDPRSRRWLPRHRWRPRRQPLPQQRLRPVGLSRRR